MRVYIQNSLYGRTFVTCVNTIQGRTYNMYPYQYKTIITNRTKTTVYFNQMSTTPPTTQQHIKLSSCSITRRHFWNCGMSGDGKKKKKAGKILAKKNLEKLAPGIIIVTGCWRKILVGLGFL